MISMFPSSLQILRLEHVSPAKTYQNKTQPGPRVLLSVRQIAREMEQEAKLGSLRKETPTLHRAAGRRGNHTAVTFPYPTEAKLGSPI